VLRAQCFSFLDRDEKAMNDINFALLLNKRNARAYAHRGTLHLAQGQDKEAIQDLKKAVEFNPASEEFMRLLARAYVSLRQYPKAYKTLQEVLAQNPFNAECLFLIAKVRLEFGVEEYKAEDELLMARSLGNPNAEKLLLDYFSPFKKLDWGKAA
jgi:tetratricopeptide (TPR) repeat protein